MNMNQIATPLTSPPPYSASSSPPSSFANPPISLSLFHPTLLYLMVHYSYSYRQTPSGPILMPTRGQVPTRSHLRQLHLGPDAFVRHRTKPANRPRQLQ